MWELLEKEDKNSMDFGGEGPVWGLWLERNNVSFKNKQDYEEAFGQATFVVHLIFHT